MTDSRRTGILIVDDSAVMRSLLRAVVNSDAQLEVAGTASDGSSALDCVALAQPDLILLDVEMPGMDGLATLRELHRRWSGIPVIMCSSLTQRGARVTIEALACGAADYVSKPTGQSDREAAVRKLAQDLLPKVRALARRHRGTSPDSSIPAGLIARQRCAEFPGQARASGEIAAPQHAMQPVIAPPSVIAIGVSTGGPAALEALLPRFPSDFPLPVLVVQHMPELFTSLLAERLNNRCSLRVREASHGDPVQAGTIYIARGNWHMETVTSSLSETPAVVRLTQDPPENHCRPSVDVLFRSVANMYGPGVLAVVLTGMGADGLNGCRMIRDLGGAVLAQDEASSAVWGMPGAVVSAGLAHRVLPLQGIAPEILRIAGQTQSKLAQPLQVRLKEVV